MIINKLRSPRQLTFNLGQLLTPKLEQFLVGDNLLLYNFLDKFSQHLVYEPFIYLWGASGSGRTHLLQSCYDRLTRLGYPCYYFPLEKQLNFNFTLDEKDFPNQYQLICVDNIEHIIGALSWEKRLFNLYQYVTNLGYTLIVTASCSPRQLDCKLLDLKSRLCSGMIFQVHTLRESEKQKAIQQRATLYGLDLTDQVAHFLLTHYPRHPNDLFKQIDQLHQASLREKRPITIPFVKKHAI